MLVLDQKTAKLNKRKSANHHKKGIAASLCMCAMIAMHNMEVRQICNTTLHSGVGNYITFRIWKLHYIKLYYVKLHYITLHWKLHYMHNMEVRRICNTTLYFGFKNYFTFHYISGFGNYITVHYTCRFGNYIKYHYISGFEN